MSIARAQLLASAGQGLLQNIEHASSVWDRHGRSQAEMDAALSWRTAQETVCHELSMQSDQINAILYSSSGYLGVTMQVLHDMGEEEAADELRVAGITAAKVWRRAACAW